MGHVILHPIQFNLFFLTIDKISPSSPVQGSQVQLAFTLSNRTDADVASGTVTGSYGGEFAITHLAKGASVSGTLTFKAPHGGKGTAVVVQFFMLPLPTGVEFPPPNAEATATMDIGYILEATGLGGGITNPAPPFNTNDPQWTAQVCQNRTFLDPSNLGSSGSDETLEWTPILNRTEELGQEVGVSGTVCQTNLKQAWKPTEDVPFLHPFYNDWTFYFALDAPYTSLLVRGNEVLSDPAHDGSTSATDAQTYAHNQGIPVPRVENVESFLEIEMEQGLVGGANKDFFPQHPQSKDDPTPGDRVAVFGRWIIDCGHPNYSAEIHPPLMLVVGRPTDASNEGTSVTVIGRAFQVSQTFDEGGLLHHLSSELTKAVVAGVVAGGFPAYQMQARPKIISPPFSGLHMMSFTVRPPSSRSSPTDTLLLSFHFTVRSGVAVEVSKGPIPDQVLVTVVMNDANYTSASLPQKHDVTVNITDLPTDAQTAIGSIASVAGFPQVLGRGIVTERYDMPPAQSVHDNENVVTNVVVEQMSGLTSVSVDDSQPYPIYGWLKLHWKRELIVVSHPFPLPSN